MTNLDRLYSNAPQQNPLNDKLNQIAQMRNLMQSINNSPNPQAMIQQMAATNPTVQQALYLINQNGNNVQQAALNYARVNGIDVNTLLQALGSK